MKKIISVFLAFVILAVSIFSAAALTTNEELNTASNWTVYGTSTQYANSSGTLAGSWAKITSNTNASYIKTGSDSLKFYTKSQYATTILSVEKNKDYQIVYSYYATEVATKNSVDYIINRMGVQTVDGVVGKTSNDNLALVGYDMSYTGGYSTKVNSELTTAGAIANEWTQATINFNSGENTSVAFYIMTGVDNVYIDDFTLVEVTPECVLNSADSWTVYTNGTSVIGSEGTVANSTSFYIKSNTNATYVKTGTESLACRSNSQYATGELTVEKNHNYSLTFSYYCTSVTENATYGDYFINRMLVAVPNSEKANNMTATTNLARVRYNSANGEKRLYDGTVEKNTLTTAGAVANQWNTAQIDFYSGNYESLVFYIMTTVAGTYYLDDFVLTDLGAQVIPGEVTFKYETNGGDTLADSVLATDTEITTANLSNPVKSGYTFMGWYTDAELTTPFVSTTYTETTTVTLYAKWQEGFVQDFENYPTSYSRLNLYTATGPEDTNVHGGSYSVTTTDKTGTKAVMLFPGLGMVPAGTYRFTAWVKLVSVSEDKMLFGVASTSSATPTETTGTYTYINKIFYSSTFDWKEVSFEFTLTEDAYLEFLTYPASGEMYIDDISLVAVNTATDINDATAWKISKSGSAGVGTNGGETPSWAKITSSTDYDKNNDGYGIKVSAIAQYAETTFEVEKNEDYTLSFDYYSDTLNSAGTYILSKVSVLTPNGLYGNTVEDPGDVISLIRSGYGFSLEEGVPTKNVGTTDTTETGWHTLKLGFNSGDNEELALSILTAVDILYLDNIAIEKGKYVPTPEEIPDDLDINDARGWKISKSGSAGVGTNGGETPSWAKILSNTDYDRNNDGYGIKVSALAQYAETTFEVEKNEDYTLSFDYYSDTLNSAGTYILSKVSVLTLNGLYGNSVENPGDVLSLVRGGSAFSLEEGVPTKNEGSTATTETGWHTLKLGFNSGDNEELALSILTAVDTLYLDNITIEKGKYTPPQRDYGTPVAETIIDFEDDTKTYTTTTGLSVVSVEGYNGETTKALHSTAGTYNSNVFLNYNSTTSDTDPIYTIPVKEKTVYTLSFRVKIAEDSEISWFSFYSYYNGGYTNIANLKTAKQGEWLYYSVPIITVEGQNRTSITFNMGKTVADVWIDDIILTETDYAIFDGYTGPQDKVIINFDDYVVPLTSAKMSVTEGPAKEDGSVDNALHIPENTSGNVFLNYSGALNHNDKVFTIPVEENGLYEISFDMYIPKRKNAEVYNFAWFSVYHDYPNLSGRTFHGTEELKKDAYRGKWITFSYTFIVPAGQDVVTFCFNAGNICPEFYLDNITLTKNSPGLLDFTTLNYCEEPFNTILSDDVDATNLLNNKTSVTKIPVKPSTIYTFASTVMGSASDEIFVSFDGTQPISCSNPESTASSVIKCSATETRYGYQFVTDRSGYIYVVMKNNSGTAKFTDVSLFTAYSISTSLDIGLEAAPLTTTTPITEIKKLAVGEDANPFDDDGSSDEDYEESGEYEENYDLENSPETGDNTLIPVALIILTLIAVSLLMLCRKENKVNE